MTKRVLISGAAGFLGSHLARHLLDNTSWHLTLLDRLDESGNLNRLVEFGVSSDPRARFVFHDLRAPISAQLAKQLGQFDYILHLAAATHVDRSIASPWNFVQDNFVGTTSLLEFARETGCAKFLYFSTDEVFGPAVRDAISPDESGPLKPSNPYSATKAAAESLVYSYANTYSVPTITTRCVNLLGERQHPEKAVPLMVRKILLGETVPIHVSADGTVGSRYYLDVQDCCAAVWHLLHIDALGYWNIGISAQHCVDNEFLARSIARLLDQPLYLLRQEPRMDRPGHDLHYAMSGEKLKQTGWAPSIPFEETLERVVSFTRDNSQWR
jgi:dTDP-glucose 4,6-dehydratase